MSDKLLTIIVPSYNMEEYLPKCLGSLIVPDEAMLQRLDVIVVNDGSKDRTSEIAHDFEKRYPGVFRVIDKENGNYGSCINVALPEAKGQYVKILDADDYVLQEGLSPLLNQLHKEVEKGENQADLVVTDYDWIHPDGSPMSHVSHLFPHGENHTFSDLAPYSYYFQMHGIVYRTHIFDGLNYRQSEGISYTDVEWALEPSVAIRWITYLPVSVTQYLIGRPGQTVGNVPMSRNYWQLVEIAKGLARRFPMRLQQCVPEARTYYEMQTLTFLASIYQNCIYGFHGHAVNADIQELEQCVRSIPEVYRATESFRMPQSHFPIRLIHAWRRHPGLGTLGIIANGLFLKVKDFKRFLHNSRRSHS